LALTVYTRDELRDIVLAHIRGRVPGANAAKYSDYWMLATAIATVVHGDQAAAQYRVTVLQAFRNVADVLRALQYDADTLKAQADAEKAARDTLALAKERYRLGASSYLNVLDSQRSLYGSQQGLISVRLARLTNLVTLYKVLGGGSE